MLTSIIPQRKGQFTIKGRREDLAKHLRKAGAAVGKLDIDVYSFRMARMISYFEAYLVQGKITNLEDGYLVEYHIRPHYFTQWLWWIAIPGNFLLLLYTDLDIARLAELTLAPAWLRYTGYLIFILSALVAFSWLVLSDMAITERHLRDIPMPSPKQEMATKDRH